PPVRASRPRPPLDRLLPYGLGPALVGPLVAPERAGSGGPVLVGALGNGVHRLRGAGVRGQDEGERRALSGLAPHLDRPAVARGDVLDDGQAEAGAPGRPGAGGVDTVEALEDPLDLGLGDSRALVGHGD